MWLAALVSVILLVAQNSARAGIRAPSCEALSAFAMGARYDPVEISFGKPPTAMTVEEFDQAIDVVQGSTRRSPLVRPAVDGQVKVTREPPGRV